MNWRQAKKRLYLKNGDEVIIGQIEDGIENKVRFTVPSEIPVNMHL